MRVRDVMTTKLFTIREDKTAFVAEEIMRWAHIRHVPIVDREGRLVGVVSHRDVLRAAISEINSRIAAVDRQQHLASAGVTRIMHRPTVTIGPDARVQDAAALMRAEKVGCLPVVEDGKLVGVVTESDIVAIVERASDAVLDEWQLLPS